MSHEVATAVNFLFLVLLIGAFWKHMDSRLEKIEKLLERNGICRCACNPHCGCECHKLTNSTPEAEPAQTPPIVNFDSGQSTHVQLADDADMEQMLSVLTDTIRQRYKSGMTGILRQAKYADGGETFLVTFEARRQSRENSVAGINHCYEQADGGQGPGRV